MNSRRAVLVPCVALFRRFLFDRLVRAAAFMRGPEQARVAAILFVVAGVGSTRAQVFVDGSDQGATLTVSASQNVQNFSVGQNIGTEGTATIEHSGTIYNVSGGVQIGNNGTGTLHLLDQAQFNSTGWMGIGASPNSTGFIDLSGGASLHASNGLAIGNETGASGTVTLSDASTSATADNFTLIGWKGTGALTVQNGAGFTSTGFLTTGDNAGAMGTFTIDGASGDTHSHAQLAGGAIGQHGTGTLNVTNGGHFNNSGSLGVGAGTDGHGSVTVSGGSSFDVENGMTLGNDVGATGSFLHTGGNTWARVANQVTVGRTGTGTLNIEDGANFNVIAKEGGGDGSLSIGSESGDGDQPGGFVTVKGKSVDPGYGSGLHVAGSINFGNAGFGQLDVLEYGYVEAGNLNLHNGIVNLTGGGVKIVTSNPTWGIYVPQSGTLNVSNGGGFVTPRFNLDGGAAHFGSYVGTTSGDGPLQSTWDVHHGAVLTHTALGFGQNAGDNTSVNVYNKGSITGSADVTIAWQGTATVNVSGGSTLTGSSTNIGGDTGSNGTLYVNGASSDATPVASSAHFGHAQVGGKGTADVNVSGGARFTADDGLSIGDQAGGNGSMWVGNPGTVATIARYLNVGREGTGLLSIQDGAQVALVLADPRDYEPGHSDNGGGYLDIGRSDDNPASDAANGVLNITGSHDGIPSRLTVAHGTTLGQQGGYGILNIDGGAELVTENVYAKNGKVSVTSAANLKVISPGGINIDGPSTFSLGGGFVTTPYMNTHGRLTGGGTITVDQSVNSDGVVDPGGDNWTGFMRIVGNLTLNGTTHLDIKKTDGATHYDTLRVEGNLSLGGAIEVALDPAAELINGQRFDVIQWTGNRNGSTPDVQISSVPGWTFLPVWEQNDLAIVAISSNPGAATFNDDFVDDTHWYDWSDQANLTFAGQKLTVNSKTSGTTKTWGASPPHDATTGSLFVGSYDSPWSVSVRTHLKSGIGTRSGDEVTMGIQVTQRRAGQNVQGNLANVALVRINHPPFANTYGVASQAVADNRFTGSITLQPDTALLEEVIVKLDYTADKKLVASYAVPVETGEPQFVTIATYDLADIWGAGTASYFRVQLLGHAEGFDPSQTPRHPELPVGEAYFQDFRSTGLIPESVALAQTGAAAANLPQITTQPNAGGAVGVLPGGGTTLQVQASGSGLTYQWRKDGQPIEDATGNSYQITSADASSAGFYDAVVRTAAGAVRSAGVPVFLLEASDAFPNFKWRNPLPSGGSLTAVVYAQNKFLAVGADGIMRTSTNGTSWTVSATVPTTGGLLNAVTYSALRNLFIAVGASGDIFTSPNTVDWTKQVSGTTNYFVAVAANDSVIVAGEAGGASYASADNGITWSRTKPDARWSISALAFGNGVFVSVGNGGLVWTSSDGTNWAQVTVLPVGVPGNSINAVKFIDNQFVAVGGNGLVMTSSNGTEWARHATGFGNYFRNVAKLGSTWVITDNSPHYLTSTDLSTFTMATLPNTSDVFVGADSGAGRIVAVGGGGEIVSTNNGTSWLSHGSIGGLDNFSDGVYANGTFVFVGSEGTIVTSPDGVRFTKQWNPDGSNWLNAITYDGSQFVAVAYDRVLTSSNAITWTAHNTQLNTGWQGIAFNGTRFVAVGDSGRIITSDDGGSSWTERVSPTGNQLLSVTAFGTGFVAVGQKDTILTSTDGETWVDRTNPAFNSNTLWRVRALNGKLYAVGDSWTLLTSADGETWTKIPLDTRGGWNVRDIVRLDSGLFIVFGIQGNYYTSPDGEHWSMQAPILTKEQIEAIVVGPNSIVLGGHGGLLLQSALPLTTPPQITGAPASQNVGPGSDVALTVQVTGPGPYSYQWFRDGAPIPGATRPRLSFVDADAGDNGDYTVTVYGVGTSVTSLPATIAVGTASAAHTDTFESNTDWALDSGQGRGNGWVNVANGRLEYITTAGGPTSLDQRGLVPSPGAAFASFNGHNALIGRTDRDWSVSVDVHVKNFSLNPDSQTTPRTTPGQGWRADLFVLDLQNALFDRGLLINAKYDATYDTTARGTITTWGNQSYHDFDATGLTEFKLAAAYQAATHMLSAYVSTDGGSSWRLQGAFDVTASLENGGWGIPADFKGTAFGIKLGAASNKLEVAAGDITFDNFTSSGLTLGAFPASVNVAPQVYGQVQSRTVAVGGSTSFSVSPHGIGPFTYQWLHDGVTIPSATSATLTLNDVQPGDAGLYRVVITNSFGSRWSQPAILGVTTTDKVVGGASEVASDLTHPEGWKYDQVRLTGAAATVRADLAGMPGVTENQTTRISYADLHENLVQVELTGAGSLSINLDQASDYARSDVTYKKGHARIVVAGASATTRLKIYSPDGVAELAYVAVLTTDGAFDLLDTSDVSFSASAGVTGIFAPWIKFTQAGAVQDVDGSADATATLIFGSVPGFSVVSGDLTQTNGGSVLFGGVDLEAVAGKKSAYFYSGVPENSPLIGSWLLGDPMADDAAVVTFLANGYYYLAHLADEPGMERGVYTWNPATKTFSASATSLGLFDSTELGGLTFISALSGATLTLAPENNTLTLSQPGEAPAILTRIRSSVDPLVGSWLNGLPGGEESSISTFLPDGHYFQVDDGIADDDGSGGPGMERGTYTFVGGILSAMATVDTSGGWGLGGAQLSLQIDGDTMIVADEGDVLTIPRVGHFVASSLPTLSGFSPAAIYPGAHVTITGSNFNDIVAVKFNGSDATSFHVDSPTQITAIAPAGLTPGSVSIVTPDGTISAGSSFTVVGHPNDAFASPQVLDPAGGTLDFTTSGATSESGELLSGTSSLWYSLTPTVSGPVQITATQANNAVRRGVFVGNSLSSVEWITNVYGGSGQPLVFNAVAGVTYHIMIGSGAGGEGSISLSWGSTSLVPPKIVTRPASRHVAPGAAVSFSVAATGTGTLSYRWQRRAAGQLNWNALTDDDTYSGTTTPELSIAATTEAMNGDQFNCSVSSDVLPATWSDQATLTVFAADVNGASAAGITLTDGSSFDLVTARKDSYSGGDFYVTLGNTPKLWANNYRQQGVADLGETTLDAADIASASSYTRNGVSLSFGHTYAVLIGTATNAPAQYGLIRITALTSTSVTLDYRVVFDSPPATSLEFLQQPWANFIQAEGQTGELFVRAVGHGVTYQWQKGEDDIPGATAPVLRFDHPVPADSGDYRVRITDGSDNLFSDVTHVTFNPLAAPQFTQQPAPQAVIAANGSRTLTFEFDAAPSPTVYVIKDAQTFLQWALPPGVSVNNYTTQAPYTHVTVELVFSNFGAAQAGSYRIALSSTAGGTLSDPVSVMLAQPPTIASFTPATIKAGDTVTITGTNFTDTIALRFNGIDAASFHVDSPTQITAVAPAAVLDGAISVVVPGGTTTSADSYSVLPRPVIVQAPQNVAVTSGQSATFEVSATGPGTLSYQWRRFGFPISGATSSSYTIPSTKLGDTDYYDVVVTNANGSTASAMARLDVAPTAYPGQLTIDNAWSVPVERESVLINQIVPLADGGFIVAGDFIKVGGHATSGVARFTAAGVVDPMFTASLEGAVVRIALQSDGKLLVAGSVSAQTPSGRRTGLIRLNADGPVDESFRPVGVNDGQAVAVGNDGKIYAYVSLDGVTGSQLLRFDGDDGSTDTTFVSAYAGRFIRGIVVQSSGKIVVGTGITINNTTSYEIGRLDTTGAIDAAFVPVPVDLVMDLVLDADDRIYPVGDLLVGTGNQTGRLNKDGGWDGSYARLSGNGTTFAIALEPNDTAVVAGLFSEVGGQTRNTVARLNADGSLAGAIAVGNVAVEVRTIARISGNGGGLIAANRGFTGSTAPNVFRINSDDEIDSSFAPTWRGKGVIKDVVRQQDGNEEKIVIAGDFVTVAGQNRPYIARLNSNGTVDTTFAEQGGPNAMVEHLRQQADGKLLLAGTFSQVDGVAQEAWARLTEDGVRDSGFVRAAGSSSYSNEKRALVSLPGGAAIVTSWWLREIMNFGLIRLRADGSFDQAFTEHLGRSVGHPFTGVVQPDGGVVLGGVSGTGLNTSLLRLNTDGSIQKNYGFPAMPYATALSVTNDLWVATGNGLSRFLPDGDFDTSFVDPVGLAFGYLSIPAIIPQNDGKMIVPAQIITVVDQPSPVAPGPRMLRFKADATIDPTFSLTGLTASVTAIVQRDDGQFYLATDGVLTRTKTLAAPSIDTPPVGATVFVGAPFSLTVSATGEYVSYQWRKGGTPIPHATGPSLEFATLKAADSGDYDVVVSNAAGTQTSAVAKLLAVPATVTASPESVTITAGQRATFSVSATSFLTPLTYQWRRNGLNIPGANTAALTLNNVPLNGGGAITVAVINSGGFVVSPPATLTVNPVAPVITSPLAVSGIVGRTFTYQIATNTVATFSATGLPAGLAINPSTGVIGGTPSATGESNITLTAHNVTGDDTKVLVLTINPPPPVIGSPVAAGGRANQVFSYTIAASNSPTSYAMTGLPPDLGLTLAGNVISGTPTRAGTFTATLTATNASGSVSQVVQFTFQPPLNAPAYSGAAQSSGTQNTLFSFTPVFTNGVTSYAIAVGALPNGLAIDAVTGTIAGTPTQVGIFAFTLRATGPGGITDVPLKIVVNPPPTAPRITSASTLGATVNVALDPAFALTTDIPAASFNAIGLPDGLTLGTATGIISGTPAAPGTARVLVAAANNIGTGPTATLFITVNHSPDAPVITSSAIAPDGRVNVSTDASAPLYQIVATNTPNHYEITFGTLPNGLQLDAGTGKITGMPTAAGTARVAFAASNVAGGRGPSLEVLFTIKPPLNVPVVTSNGTAAGRVGQPFSYTITGTNAPTAFAATNLPAWLTQSNSGTGPLLSGIPTTATTTSLKIAVTAANVDGTSAAKLVSISIAPAPATPVITSATTSTGRVGSEFLYGITASENANSFSAVDLPPGLTADAATGEITGTPTQAGTFTVKLSAGNTFGSGPLTKLTLSIAPAPQAPAITSAPSVTGKVGVTFSYAIVATPGPITGYALANEDDELPTGLALNTATGVISGKPAEPGLFFVGLTATSANGTSLPQPLLIAINPADAVPVITSPIYALATVGSDFTYTIMATNMPGTTPFPPAVTLDAVNLPDGLAANPSTGTIQGRPVTAGIYTATLIGTNAAGTGPSRSLTIFVQPKAEAPVITSVPTVAGQVGVGFVYQINATNSPIAYEVVDAPAWMTINGQSGALGGTPTDPGTFTAQLVASNAEGASNPATLALYIAPAANTPVITSSRAASGQLGASFSYVLMASRSPTSFVARGLPAGLTLTVETIPIDGTPTTVGLIDGTPAASGVFNVVVSAKNENGAGQPVTVTITINPSLQIVVP